MERTFRTSCCPRRFSRGRGGTGVFPTWLRTRTPSSQLHPSARLTERRAPSHLYQYTVLSCLVQACAADARGRELALARVPENPVACAPSASRPLSSVESPGRARAGAPNLPEGVSESHRKEFADQNLRWLGSKRKDETCTLANLRVYPGCGPTPTGVHLRDRRRS